MATSNFYTINAKSYYVFNDTFIDEDENGNEIERYREEWEWDDLLCDICYRGEENNLFPHPTSKYNNKIKAKEICESASIWETFGKSYKLDETETLFKSVIAIRSGYYSGGILDYDILVETCKGDMFYLSDYDTIEDLVEDYLDIVEDNFVTCTDYTKLYKLQKKNIRKWVTNKIENEIEKCEKFCKDVCEMELAVSARFSNGETWYKEVK